MGNDAVCVGDAAGVRRPLAALLIATIVGVACSHSAARGAPPARSESKQGGADRDGNQDGGKKEASAAKKEKGKKDGEQEDRPACGRCGATCGLVAFCRCEPGTKKKPKVEYDVKCDPICVAGCGGLPCRHGRGGGSCCDDRCSEACCNAWVRQRKVLKKTTTDEEVETIKRTVEYVCCRCLEPPDCAASTSCTEPGRRHEGWFPAVWEWWSQLCR